MIIRNRQSLTKGSALREKALCIIESGLRAIDPVHAIHEKITIENGVVCAGSHHIDVHRFKRIFFIGIGKAALSAAQGIENVFGTLITDGVCLDVRSGPLRRIQSIIGTHPFPSEQNVQATARIKKMISGLRRDDLIITAITGGGSTLLCSSPKMTCEQETDLVRHLFAAGATIEEINTVRKHISDIRGGGLARLAYPATMLSLIISDTPGCSMDMVASGPTLPDPTTMQDARKILKKYAFPRIGLVETPKEQRYFARVHHMLLLCNMDALNAMHHQALALGYRTRVVGNALSGEARTIAERYIQNIGKREALIGGGETTVTLTGRGKGGRNQEVVLGALPFLSKGMVVVSINSDGCDNTDAAGAIADEKTFIRAKKKGYYPARYLKKNDSYHFFEALGDLIMTGPTGTNVSDLFLCVRE